MAGGGGGPPEAAVHSAQHRPISRCAAASRASHRGRCRAAGAGIGPQHRAGGRVGACHRTGHCTPSAASGGGGVTMRHAQLSEQVPVQAASSLPLCAASYCTVYCAVTALHIARCTADVHTDVRVSGVDAGALPHGAQPHRHCVPHGVPAAPACRQRWPGRAASIALGAAWCVA